MPPPAYEGRITTTGRRSRVSIQWGCFRRAVTI